MVEECHVSKCYSGLSSLDFVHLPFTGKHVFGHFRGDLSVCFACEIKHT